MLQKRAPSLSPVIALGQTLLTSVKQHLCKLVLGSSARTFFSSVMNSPQFATDSAW